MFRRILITITLAVFIVLTFRFLNSTISTQAIDIVWTFKDNYSILDDKPYAVCIIGDYIYIVGYDRSELNTRFRVEKRYKYDGSLVKVWVYNPSTMLDDILLDCTVIDDKLFAVGVKHMFSTYGGFESGKLVVIALDSDLNLLNIVEGPNNTFGYSVTSDGNYIYVGGVQRVGAHTIWYIEKRDLNLALITNRTYTFTYTDVSDHLYSLVFNPVTKTLWVVGCIDSQRWGIVILNTNLDIISITKSYLGGSALSITFDDLGYAYVAGIGILGDKSVIGIVKYDPSGNEVVRIPNYYGAKISYINGDVYVFFANPGKHMVYIFDQKLRLQKTLFLNNNTGCKGSDIIGEISTDGTTIFFATNVCITISDFHEDSEWIIYAFTPLTKRYFFTIKTTITKTTTFTIVEQLSTTLYLPTTVIETYTLYTATPITIFLTTMLNTTIVHKVTTTSPITHTIQNIATKTITTTKPHTVTDYTTLITTSTVMLRETETINKTATITLTYVDTDGVATASALILFICTFMLVTLLLIPIDQRK